MRIREKNQKMKTTVFTLALLLLAQFSIGQNSVSGTVYEGTTPLEFANVVLYSLPDSTLIKGETTDNNGQFKIEKIKDGSYFLKVLMLGYNDKNSLSFELNASNPSHEIRLEINAEENVLDEIEVVAKVPLLEQRADRMVVNVAKSLTGNSGSLMEIMRKVPGMLVINNKLSMPGGGSPAIYIDGRPTNYIDTQSLLREMPGDNIERIEVISQPGAEFDAAGNGPIINIILKKNKLFGTNGSVRAGMGKATYWNYRSSFRINSRQGKFNLHGGGGYSRNTWNETLKVDRILDGDRLILNNTTPYLPKTFRGRAGVDYYITEKQAIGVEFNAATSTNNRDDINMTDVIYADMSPTTLLETTNSKKRDWNKLNATAYYNIELDTLGQRLDFDVNAIKFDRSSSNNVSTINRSGDGVSFADTKTEQPGTVDIFATKIDYTKPINKVLQLQFGGKYSIAKLDNNLQAWNYINDEWVINQGQSNHFIFDEDILAGYGKATFNNDDWEVSAGLRYEDSKSNGYSVTLDSTTVRDIEKFFPSGSIGKKLTNELKLGLAYSYRIERPRYGSLNPFISYIDPFTLEKGSPFLKPELTHNVKLSLSYENQPFFSLSHSETSDYISFVTEVDTINNTTSAFDVNFDKFTKTGGQLGFPLSFIKGLDGFGGFELYHTKYYDEEPGRETFDVKAWSFSAFMQVNYTLPWDIKAEFTGWYTNGGQDDIFRMEWLYGTELGFEKKFLDKQLAVNVSFENFLNRFAYMKVDYYETVGDIVSTWDNKVVNVNVTYNFGNKYLKNRKGRRNSAQDELNRASEN